MAPAGKEFFAPLRMTEFRRLPGSVLAAVLFVLFDDEVIGHAGNIVADHAGQGFLCGFLLVIVREG